MPWPLSLIWPGSSESDKDDAKGAKDKENSDGSVTEAGSSAVKEVADATPSPTDLLQHFEQPGLSIPPGARVGDPKLKQRERQPLSLWQLGKMAAFGAAKATELFSELVYHHVWGPRRKSWAIEMTLLSALMRNVGQHTHLGDMSLIRMLMSVSGYIPVSSDALVTPVTFPVRRRKLPGILAELDAAENGRRELSGEWVVGKRTWRRLQSEWRAQRTQARSDASSSPGSPSQEHRRNERVVLYLHGGAYYTCNAASHRLITIPLAKYLDARLFAVDYRLAPETRFPGPLHDVVSAYLRLVDDLHIPPENIIVAGDSAGGGLSLALLLYLRDNGLPLPSAAILFSPWVDLTMSCDSWDSNAEYDIVPRPVPGDHLNPIACYLGEHMEKYLTHPYASPLFGDFRGLPPMLIQAGECEVLRDEITLLAHKAKLAGVEVRHELYEDAVHVFQALPFLEAAQHAFGSCLDFVLHFLPQFQRKTPQELAGATERGLEQEIDTDAQRVVRGDGMETASRREDISSGSGTEQARERPELTVDASRGESPSSSDQEGPSWSAQWPTPPESDGSDESDGEDEHLRMKRKDVAANTSARESERQKAHSERHKPQHRPSLRRLRSTFSFIADASYRSASEHVQTAPAHRGEPSFEHQQAAAAISRARTRVGSMTSMVPSKGPVPSPSLRKKLDASHPDIHSLIQQYASSGPAHETTTFRPDDSQQRKRSRTLSSLAR
ncbi:lipase/ esterase [Rhodofomes roseus]|uniref:Lipase/ esterase n=1 Tax=Rhodofomes roseus TaxID=34475 RepID=A0ABQ8KHJ6_9APHY|nr:lipase/ esterase [Rhodofomes roseus]KAH9837277.1 lipase/ esterase [Rhodofomes roseus]